LKPWPPLDTTKPSPVEINIFSTLPDVDFLALPSSRSVWESFPETRRRLAAAEYVVRERAKKRDRTLVIREAENIYGPFSVSLADWLRRPKRRR
jgi:hypothetical protein